MVRRQPNKKVHSRIRNANNGYDASTQLMDRRYKRTATKAEPKVGIEATESKECIQQGIGSKRQTSSQRAQAGDTMHTRRAEPRQTEEATEAEPTVGHAAQTHHRQRGVYTKRQVTFRTKSKK